MKISIKFVKKIANRIYSDFFLPDRLSEWEYLLCKAIENDYLICSIQEFQNKIKTNGVDKSKKCLIIRHDIDTDLSTAKKIWELEKNLKVFASYYFRLSTIDITLMTEINDCGAEASYHCEELATYAKHKGFTNKNQALDHLDAIRGIFKKNLESLRMQTGIPMRTVASHGDWMNRKLGITNCVILDDKDFRKDLGIELETYDSEFMNFVTSRHADSPYPVFWKPDNPINAINRQEKVIYILVHPRQWRANITVNLIDNIYRAWEGITYFIKTWGKN